MNQPSKILVEYINGLPDFVFKAEMDPYQHLGATLTDTIFQAGVNYNSTVVPRIKKIKSYDQARTISGLKKLFAQVNADDFFQWQGRKPRNFLSLISFLESQYVDTEDDLKRWLLLPGSCEKLIKQPGFGKKTVDYLKILVGIPGVAVDRHIITFLEKAGIFTDGYEEARAIVVSASQILGVSPSVLDHSIWYYLSNSS